MKNNIVLIGFMGCGKTSIGDRLANRLSFSFLDTDKEIEQRAGMTITDIFEKYGEEYFRDLETNTIKELIETTENTIISTGGGMPLRQCNADLLKELGMVIYLYADVETTYVRVKSDTKRPLLAGGNLKEKIATMLTEREPKYLAASDVKIVTDRTFGKIIQSVVKEYELFTKRGRE